jgi:hypothetical protein
MNKAWTTRLCVTSSILPVDNTPQAELFNGEEVNEGWSSLRCP